MPRRPARQSLIRVLVSSPSDVTPERVIAERVIRRLNQTLAEPLGYHLRPWLWEKDAVPGIGFPQNLINAQIGEYDIYLGILWARFGTPTLQWGGGTEEEFHIAYDRFKSHDKPRILFYFKNVSPPFTPVTATVDDVEQLLKVVSFRTGFAGRGIYGTFSDEQPFEDLLSGHLAQLITNLPPTT